MAQRALDEMAGFSKSALIRGEFLRSRLFAVRGMQHAKVQGDLEAQAHFSLLLAKVLWVTADPASSLSWGERAADLARTVQDRHLLSAALTMQSCAATAIGWNDAAMACAKAALEHTSEELVEAANATHYLGLALAWANEHERAQTMLTRSAEMGRTHAQLELSFQPLVNQGIMALAKFSRADQSARASSLERHRVEDLLAQNVNTCRQFHTKGRALALNEATEPLILPCFLTVESHLFLLQGKTGDAEANLRKIQRMLGMFEKTHWVHACTAWLEHELATESRNEKAAVSAAHRMEGLARRGGHHGLAVLGRQLRLRHAGGRPSDCLGASK